MRKNTSQPAERYGLGDRRRPQGFRADVVAFRVDRSHSPATYETPELPPVGIEFVYRNGAGLSSEQSMGTDAVLDWTE
jgi:N-acyl-D-aspartate/D-glutamate deacylase